MAPVYEILAARPEDLALLGSIEVAAVTLFTGPVFDSVPHQPTAENVLSQAQRDGRLWVARAGELPVGFAMVGLVEPDVAHLEELDVHPDHGRRGVGTRLVEHVCRWAATCGHGAVTLTTYRDVPWNMPFYARLGFEVVPASELSRPLRTLVDDEARRGLDPAIRVVMRRATSA
jgi:GNAT superfamily N-acetyltransferase